MKKIISFLFLFVCLYSNAQTNCGNAQPFCAGATASVNFPASTNQPDAFPSSYDCLGSSPNPAWYYLQVSTGGNIILHIAGTANQDVDFICWGPFTSQSSICANISTSNVVDCSYSSSYTETCTITNAIPGQFYMVLITNFSNQVQNITFNQIGGTGSTNCALLTANNSSICAGSTATIVANNAGSLTATSYSINPGAQTSPTPTFVVSPVTTTNYTVYITGTNASNVVVTQTALSTVTVSPQPSTAPTATQTSCTNTVNAFNLGLTFNPSIPAPSYTVGWSPIPNGVGSPTQTAGSGGIAPGLYNATITAAGGCSTTTSFSISPTPLPASFNLVPNASVYSVTCSQPTVFINLNPPTYTYSWTNGVSAPQTGSVGIFTSANQGTWTVVGVNPSGCVASQTFIITQNISTPSSTVSPSIQNIACNNNTISSTATFTGTALSPTSNVTHSWYSPSSTVAATSGGSMSIYSPGGTGTYTYCLTDNINGCSVCKTVTVTSTNAYPTFLVSSPQQFTIGCGTTSLTTISISNVNTYTAFPGSPTGGAVSYTVLIPTFSGTYSLDPQTGPSVYNVNAPGQYTVIVHDNTNGCETKVPISIISNTFAPTLTATAVQTTLTCDVPKTILQGISGTPNVSYSWAFPGPPAGQLPNDTLTVFITSNTSNTIVATYTLSVTDNINLCKSTQTLIIYQNIAPPIAVIGGSNSITCNTPTISLTNLSYTNAITAAFNHNGPVTGYIWSGPSPQPTQQLTSTYIAFTPATATNAYTLVVKDLNNGCVNTATKTISDNRIYPIINTPSAPPPFILDCASPNATIYPIVSPPTANLSYLWITVPTVSFGVTSSSITTVNKPGAYKIIVTNTVNGCVAYGNVEVVNGSLNGDFNPSTTNGYAPLTVNFQNLSASSSSTTPSASITSVWSFGNGSTQITQAVNISPSTTYVNPGTYTVTMYVSKGSCIDTMSKVITVEIPSKLEVPNVFTPNGDGSNDVFFLHVANVTDINALIFDRWGNKVFETTSTTGNIEWDGKNMSGKESSVGTYFYIIKATGKDGTSYDKKGNVSLYR